MAAMVVPRLPVDGRVQPLADRGEREVVEEELRGLAGLQLLLPQSAGQVEIALRLRALPGARICRCERAQTARSPRLRDDFRVVARLIYQMLLARMSAGQ